MCGIAGFVGRGDRADLDAMLSKIQHRGPDGVGTYFDNGVALGHARLAIIDPDARSLQPMSSADGRYVIVFNGEIYNYKELKRDLRAYPYRTESDTEVILALVSLFGVEGIRRLGGMYALALYDTREHELFFARDRFGQKPLFIAPRADGCVFGSELGAVLAHPSVVPEVDEEALARYFTYSAVPAPHSLISGVFKAMPGTVYRYKKGVVSKVYTTEHELKPFNGSIDTAQATLDTLLTKSIHSTLISDVPLGVFLSGGVDSSTIAYYASKARPGIKTFSIGFDDPSYDESGVARETAKHLGTEHFEHTVRGDELIRSIPAVIESLSEPLADQSFIPMHALSLFAREHVKVALGGDGADELFMGYPTFYADDIAKYYSMLPQRLQQAAAAAAKILPNQSGYMNLKFLAERFVRSAGEASVPRRHARWLAPLSEQDERALYEKGDTMAYATELYAGLKGSDSSRVRQLYAEMYLTTQVLVKSDIASMAHGLEVRAPFLESPLANFAFSLPESFIRKGKTGKKILRDLMAPRLPHYAARGKKHGFGVPMATWLRGPLRSQLDTLNQTPHCNHEFVKQLVDEHLAGRDHSRILWALIVYVNWYNRVIT